MMMRSAGYTLVSSFPPVRCLVFHNRHRTSSKFVVTDLATSKRVYCHGHIHSLEAEPMVVARYQPPRFSVAPMMEWTDVHYRTLARIISKHAWVWTEMLAVETIVHQKGNLVRFLAFPPEQHPVVLQIGGNNLENIAKATQLANAYGYDEINLNCGCPSPRVAGSGCFGVRLILDPKFVGEAMSVIASNTDVPVIVKCRIGVDDRDSYNELCDFIYKVSSTSPTKHFIIHSRKADFEKMREAERIEKMSIFDRSTTTGGSGNSSTDRSSNKSSITDYFDNMSLSDRSSNDSDKRKVVYDSQGDGENEEQLPFIVNFDLEYDIKPSRFPERKEKDERGFDMTIYAAQEALKHFNANNINGTKYVLVAPVASYPVPTIGSRYHHGIHANFLAKPSTKVKPRIDYDDLDSLIDGCELFFVDLLYNQILLPTQVVRVNSIDTEPYSCGPYLGLKYNDPSHDPVIHPSKSYCTFCGTATTEDGDICW